MLKYLIILLDDTSISFCYNENERNKRRILPISLLRDAIVWGMKENTFIQFVYPEYELPQEYNELIESIEHAKIKPATCANNADIIVFNSTNDVYIPSLNIEKTYVLRLCKEELLRKIQLIKDIIAHCARLNLVITDINQFTENDFDKYHHVLHDFAKHIENLYISGKEPQFNILTDRMFLDGMNNCEAGEKSITLAPDGNFYVCPAFYQSPIASRTILGSTYTIGSLADGLDIKNSQLYKKEYAPLCRICDAYQCKRCVWLNRKTTLEVNTPSHEQCVVSHLERNTSRELMTLIRKHGIFFPDKDIPEIKYTDPFEVKEEWL